MPQKTTVRKKSAPKKTPAKKAVKRTVTKAAKNVQTNAERARDLSAALIRAGELLGQGAAFLDSVADRAITTSKQKSRRKAKK